MNKKITLFLMTQKGLQVLKRVVSEFSPDVISEVIVSRDGAVRNDYADEIMAVCDEFSIRCSDKISDATASNIGIAVSWRTLLPIDNGKRLIVFHDSLLPKYRGFNPLVTALINGDCEVGASAMWASERYDRGQVILQKSCMISYPITIQMAIEKVCSLYEEMVIEIIRCVQLDHSVPGKEQDESKATYSIWRDDDDYWIDWSKDASYVKRFVDAVGFPYKGACCLLAGKMVRVEEVEVIPLIRVENNTPGKIFELDNGCPVVLCGEGLIKITKMCDGDGLGILPLKKLKQRFS